MRVTPNLFVVWEDGARSNPDQGCHSECNIFFRRSTDQGITWVPPLDQPATQLSSGSAYPISPQVVVSGNVVIAVWADLGTGLGIAYRCSTDSGKTFAPAQGIPRLGRLDGIGFLQAVTNGSSVYLVKTLSTRACRSCNSSCNSLFFRDRRIVYAQRAVQMVE
jgi:hypothetical protein